MPSTKCSWYRLLGTLDMVRFVSLLCTSSYTNDWVSNLLHTLFYTVAYFSTFLAKLPLTIATFCILKRDRFQKVWWSNTNHLLHDLNAKRLINYLVIFYSTNDSLFYTNVHPLPTLLFPCCSISFHDTMLICTVHFLSSFSCWMPTNKRLSKYNNSSLPFYW